MRKPQDPRNHGLKEPKEVISKTERLYLADLDSDGHVSLESVIGAWNKAVKDHESQGHRITQGPYFESGSYYGHSITLAYTYEWDNLNYSVEKAEFDLLMSNYQAELITFHQVEEAVRKNPPNLDQKIERTKQRLANLEATKAGLPIPYPDM
jgi:hypothetical protein